MAFVHNPKFYIKRCINSDDVSANANFGIILLIGERSFKVVENRFTF